MAKSMKCSVCGKKAIGHGKTIKGNKRFRCKLCKITFIDHQHKNSVLPGNKNIVIALYSLGYSKTMIGKLIGKSRQTVSNWIDAGFVKPTKYRFTQFPIMEYITSNSYIITPGKIGNHGVLLLDLEGIKDAILVKKNS